MDINNIPPDDLPIWQAYNGHCVLCGAPAICLHEEPPKSLNPHWRQEPWTRYALCNDCHISVHEMSRKDAAYVLDFARPDSVRDALLKLK